MTNEQKIKRVNDFIKNSISGPFRKNIDYVGISRRTFLTEPLPAGTLPIYDKYYTDDWTKDIENLIENCEEKE